MKGFYWGRGTVRCSFCKSLGHNITTCKAVDREASRALKKITDDNSYICSPSEHLALIEIKKREERKAKARKPRSPSSCSFCKEPGHKRPSCPHLKDFRQLVYKANKNWKKSFAQAATKVGVGVGSLVKFDPQTEFSLDFNVDSNRIAMITSYDFSNLNVFCAYNKYSDYQSNATIKVLSGDREDSISVKYLSSLLNADLLHQGWWYSSSYPEVLSPMPFTADQEWLDSEWDEILDWFFESLNEEKIKAQV